MNKTEKIICIALGLLLVAYLWYESAQAKERMRLANEQRVAEERAAAEQAAASATNATEAVSAPAGALTNSAPVAVSAPLPPPEEVETPRIVHPSDVTLENDDVKLELSSRGAVVQKVTLKKFAERRGEISEQNPPVVLDFSESPLGELGGVPGLAPDAEYGWSVDGRCVVFTNSLVTRRVTLGENYQITFDETFSRAAEKTANTLSIGRMGTNAKNNANNSNAVLAVDSFAMDAGKGEPGIVHHGSDDSPLKGYLLNAGGGCGCGGAAAANDTKMRHEVVCPGAQKYVALKDRFFVTALASSDCANNGFKTVIRRDAEVTSRYAPKTVDVSVSFADVPATRSTTFYVGPKKQAVLGDLGMREVMDFGMWSWLCYPLVWVLNFFYKLIPNYGVSIILLTILVRILFWPLTRKSTLGMKKMQEIQPLMKELQKKYKGNPQRLQQETWALYKEKKVNPLSSCLPMLIQIPVFIALFNVLRSAVELRFAPFLWIGDLSEPEGLFAAYLPRWLGGLNLLPIVMAVTTALQTKFTPSTGDNSQQKMMMYFMPVMMLVMFYAFPAALSLYWCLNNILSIVQMWMIRRQTAKEQKVLEPDLIIDPPSTRQMRRHQ